MYLESNFTTATGRRKRSWKNKKESRMRQHTTQKIKKHSICASIARRKGGRNAFSEVRQNLSTRKVG